MSVQRLLVVGGNGFVGHAVCRAALSRGWEVSSISASGTPFKTPKGHTPDWISKVSWHAASAFTPEAYASLLPETTAVVHTIGVLFEDNGYKTALRQGNLPELLKISARSATNSSNPLKNGGRGTYESMNYDSALMVLKTYLATLPTSPSPLPFVYLSAEDIFRPWISDRYISSKRLAEQGIEDMCSKDGNRVRGVYLRPSLIYHAHLRPLTSPIAAMLSLSSTFHRRVSKTLPTPGGVLRAIAPTRDSALASIANALEIPPIHVDHVAEAACAAIERTDISGILDTQAMRTLIGWSELGEARVDGIGADKVK